MTTIPPDHLHKQRRLRGRNCLVTPPGLLRVARALRWPQMETTRYSNLRVSQNTFIWIDPGYPATEPRVERRAKISDLAEIQVLLYGIDGKL